MSRDFVRPIDHVDIGAYPHGETRDRGIRLYRTASAEIHGGDNARYALQIFAPRKLANGTEGRDYLIATASLSPRDLVALHAETGAAIAEVEHVAPHALAPSHADTYARIDATLTPAKKARRAHGIEGSIRLIRATMDSLPVGADFARSCLNDAVSELARRARELRGVTDCVVARRRKRGPR